MLLDKIESDNKLYLDLEKISNRVYFEEDNYDNILQKLQNDFGLNFKTKAYLALDEIQLLKNIPSIVKYLYDHYKIKFILTGSSSYYLKNLFKESLSGRKRIFELYTLDFNEFLKFKQIFSDNEYFMHRKYSVTSFNRLKEYYEEFIRYGGFPEVVLETSKKEKEAILRDILDSYIRIDIKNFSDFENYSAVFNLIKAISSRTGNKLDISKIAPLSGVSRTTVSKYIELFEGTYFLQRIPVLSKNPDREIVRAPKLYIHDNGLLNTLAQVSSGVQFENAVFNQLKHFGELRYYSLKTGREIDFIMNSKYSFEAKEKGGEYDLKKLARLSNNLGINNNYVISRYSLPDDYSHNKSFIWGGDVR
jgi:predicted AAA+ superfamily ATPase